MVFISSVYVQQVPNKSHSQELNNVLFVVIVVKYLGLVSRTLGPKKDLKDRIHWAAEQDGRSFILSWT